MQNGDMMRVRWLQRARRALDAEISFLAQENMDVARQVYAHIQEQIALLPTFPHLGRQGRVWGTRELIITHYPYIIPYRVKNDVVEILTVFHTRRQIPQH